jgi:hypothetical protein
MLRLQLQHISCWDYSSNVLRPLRCWGAAPLILVDISDAHVIQLNGRSADGMQAFRNSTL